VCNSHILLLFSPSTFPPTSIEWGEWWIKKSKDRYEKLKVEKRISNETLFHEDINLHELEMWVSVRGIG
jgi:hypothetical protein